MAASDLARSIDYRKRNGLDAREYEDIYWGRWFYPFNVLALCLAAIPFAFGSLRSGGLGKRLFFGILFALGFWLLQLQFSRLAGRVQAGLPHRLPVAADPDAGDIGMAVQAKKQLAAQRVWSIDRLGGPWPTLRHSPDSDMGRRERAYALIDAASAVCRPGCAHRRRSDVSREWSCFRDSAPTVEPGRTAMAPARRARRQHSGSGFFRQPYHPRAAGAVVPGQPVAVEPRPPEAQPAQQQGHGADRVTQRTARATIGAVPSAAVTRSRHGRMPRVCPPRRQLSTAYSAGDDPAARATAATAAALKGAMFSRAVVAREVVAEGERAPTPASTARAPATES